MGSRTRDLVLAGVLAALTAIGAFLKFPLGEMSVTLQFMFTALAGVLLGAKWGAVSQAAYVILGLVGLPIFTMGGGIGYVFQPSFGFLLGLIPAAAVTGALAGKRDKPARVALACAAGLAVLYLVGLPYMGCILNLYMGAGKPISAIIWGGMVVYLPGDALKILAVTVLARPLTRALAAGGRA